MTSAVRGREGGSRFLTIGGGGCVISILRILTRGEGVQNLENLADVIYEWPLVKLEIVSFPPACGINFLILESI